MAKWDSRMDHKYIEWWKAHNNDICELKSDTKATEQRKYETQTSRKQFSRFHMSLSLMNYRLISFLRLNLSNTLNSKNGTSSGWRLSFVLASQFINFSVWQDVIFWDKLSPERLNWTPNDQRKSTENRTPNDTDENGKIACLLVREIRNHRLYFPGEQTSAFQGSRV